MIDVSKYPSWQKAIREAQVAEASKESISGELKARQGFRLMNALKWLGIDALVTENLFEADGIGFRLAYDDDYPDGVEYRFYDSAIPSFSLRVFIASLPHNHNVADYIQVYGDSDQQSMRCELAEAIDLVQRKFIKWQEQERRNQLPDYMVFSAFGLSHKELENQLNAASLDGYRLTHLINGYGDLETGDVSYLILYRGKG